MSEDQVLERLKAVESYIGYRAWCLAEQDEMTREDLAQQARCAIIEKLKTSEHYPNTYLRKVANSAMLLYLSRGKSVDRPWPYCDRKHVYPIVSLDTPSDDGRDPHEVVLYRSARFERAAQARIMLDELEPHLKSREQLVLRLLREGHSQVDIADMLGCDSSRVYAATRSIRKKARGMWDLASEGR